MNFFEFVFDVIKDKRILFRFIGSFIFFFGYMVGSAIRGYPVPSWAGGLVLLVCILVTNMLANLLDEKYGVGK